VLIFISEISVVLREALVQAIKTSASALPSSAFPMSASTFYTGHVLPARPVRVAFTSPPADIKHSTFKSFSTFLKQAEKQGLLRIKDTKGDTVIVSVNTGHEDVILHAVYRTVGELEIKQKKQREKQDKRGREEEIKEKQVNVIELWKPHQTTIKLFQEAQLE
jgi:translation initiation factor 2D